MNAFFNWRCGVAVCAAMGLVSAAQGHAFLDHATPKVGAVLDSSPTEVVLHFDDDLQADKSGIQVFDAAGKQIDKKDVHAPADAGDKATLSVSLPANLSPGVYKVVWHALCPDSHKTEGTFQFTVKGSS